mmetsp:Transcript_6292/g.18994  ORF Transcript_6292/g.18994 Transcript_6292/m.18994 type:complete len:348 (+) Transcript_6292:186-1229(+)|eukprot:CAMPEP_0198728540 /NCGR_PEP_ID=MMETSP1475-20131203/9918_1 /TAXON_ID= ORGANISM="Unidentified sp., Strain CCMP1999" /NCGR_SAMPLE_ID=MMETSP1475 /ASSEMBLY_ACC=CAM_ASM_001111 /LENGTH=347 /DNA_ID=CAMNT_0044490939 /DNA_START=144 /DNA_END=1187 /DNA_ORIENTATION=-
MAGRAAALVLGSGMTGAYLIEHQSWMGEAMRGFTGADVGAAGGAAVSAGTEELIRSVNALSRSVASSASVTAPSVTIVGNGDGGDGGGNILVGAGVSVASAAALALYLHGKALARYLWVSRRNFSETVDGLQSTIQSISSKLRGVSTELTDRIFQMEDKLVKTKSEINNKVDTEVASTKQRINIVGMTVNEVQDIVDGLQKRLEDLQAKANYSNRGILLLCQAVGSMPHHDKKSSRLWDELKKFTSSRSSTGKGEPSSSKRLGSDLSRRKSLDTASPADLRPTKSCSLSALSWDTKSLGSILRDSKALLRSASINGGKSPRAGHKGKSSEQSSSSEGLSVVLQSDGR